jgi:hypothetical protein
MDPHFTPAPTGSPTRPDEPGTPSHQDDDAIRALITRLARPHASGGRVIERAAIMAEGADSAAIITWIDAHAGEPEEAAPATGAGGLHGGRLHDSGSSSGRAPRRYVLPPGALS